MACYQIFRSRRERGKKRVALEGFSFRWWKKTARGITEINNKNVVVLKGERKVRDGGFGPPETYQSAVSLLSPAQEEKRGHHPEKGIAVSDEGKKLHRS